MEEGKVRTLKELYPKWPRFSARMWYKMACHWVRWNRWYSNLSNMDKNIQTEELKRHKECMRCLDYLEYHRRIEFLAARIKYYIRKNAEREFNDEVVE